MKTRLTFLALLALGSSVGVAIQMLTAADFAAAIGTLRYYTIQSNLLVVVAAILEIVLLLARGRTGKRFELFRMAVVIAIMVTGILFAFLLSGRWHPEGIRAFSNILIHYFTPAMTVLVWVLFAEKGFLHLRQAPLWVIFPFLYLAYVLIQGTMTGFYPYWFLNPCKSPPDGIGSWAGLAGFVGLICAGFLVAGALFVLVDGFLAKRKTRVP